MNALRNVGYIKKKHRNSANELAQMLLNLNQHVFYVANIKTLKKSFTKTKIGNIKNLLRIDILITNI